MKIFGFRKPRFMQSTAERFESQLTDITGCRPIVFRHKSTVSKLPNIYSYILMNYPMLGVMTAYTLGVSFADQFQGKSIKPELVIQIKSDDVSWGNFLAFIGKHLRTTCPFEEGQLIAFGQQIVKDSLLTEFVIIPTAKNLALTESERTLRKDHTISMVQLVPIYKSEVDLVRQVGWQSFVNRLGEDILNTKRQRLS